MSAGTLAWPPARERTLATRTFPSAALPTKGLPIEVNLVAQLSPGAGTPLIHETQARQSQHGRFVDALDEPSAKLGGSDFAKGDATALYSFCVGAGGHPFHRHAGHRVFTAISGSAGAQLRFSTATDEEMARDPASFVRALRHVHVPPDCLFTVRFSGENWHQFVPLQAGSRHPAFFALSTHTNELGGNLSEDLRRVVLADDGDIPTLTELLPPGVLALLERQPVQSHQVPTTTLALTGRSDSWSAALCGRYRSLMGHLKAALARLRQRTGSVTESNRTSRATQTTVLDQVTASWQAPGELAPDSLLRDQLNDRTVHHEDSFQITMPAALLPAQDAGALLAQLLDAFVCHRHAGVSRVMALRNLLVRPLALRRSPLACPVSSLLSDTAPQSFGGHPVLAWQVAEGAQVAQVVLGADDKHLAFRSVVDVRCGAAGEVRFTLATRVACRNASGRMYMALIAGVHRRYIVPRLLAVAVDAVAAEKRVPAMVSAQDPIASIAAA